MKKTKIIATIGPSTNSKAKIEEMIKAGVDVFRLNFSHADHKTHRDSIKTVRDVADKLDKPTAILQDISGPKIRIGEINGILELKKGDKIKLVKNKEDDEPYALTISHPEIIDRIEENEFVFFADGSIRAKVVKKHKDYLDLLIQNEGVLSSKKGVNFPHSNLKISAITEKDKTDLIFGAKEDVDLVAVSFVNSKKDILKAREILNSHNADPWIIAKIETKKAVENINEIIKASDGIMVARGDLGIEVGLEKVPIIQKKIIKKANAAGKPVITATQMLLGMVNSPYPTRAEVSDAANAVMDGSDAVMLSDETTVGKYPIKAVETLVKVILETQNIYLYFKKYEIDDKDAIAAGVADLCKGTSPTAIVSFSVSGTTIKSIAKYRPKTPIYAVTHSNRVLRRLSLIWGVQPYFTTLKKDSPDELIEDLIKVISQMQTFKKGDKLILTMGSVVGEEGKTNMIRILEV